MITFRSSTAGDADGLARCVDAVARERRYLATTEGFGPEATRAFIHSIDRRGGAQLVALDGDTVVGWCDILPHAFDGMRHVGHLGMGVLSAYRRRGLGRRLLREAVALAFAKGVRRVQLEVFSSNEDAIRLYGQESFVVDGRRRRARVLDGIEDDVVLMSLEAPAPAAGLRPNFRVPRPIGSPVLESVLPVVSASRHVHTNVAKIVEHAQWMACEELPLPDFGPSFGPADSRERLIDFVMVSTSVNTAFTDFATGEVFEVDYAGRRWLDAEAMMACLRRAMDAGIPVLDGRFLAEVSREELARLFAGNIEMPMLDEKLEVLNDVGRVLAQRYDGRFHRFLDSCSPRLFDSGRGLVDRLVIEFPRFSDASLYDGREVKFYKLTQLGFWILFCTLRRHGGFRIDDLESMTAFADYIVPVALRAMDILEYSPRLDEAIATRTLVPRDSEEEIEIRAHTIYSTALLREELNKLRPPHLQVSNPQVDARLWTMFHTTHCPHHLTRTIMY